MKTLFVSLVAFLFAFIIGCQESSITDPVLNNSEINQPTEEPVYLDKDLINYYPGVIKLSGMIFDPSHLPHGYVKTEGTVRYRVTKLSQLKNVRSGLMVQLYVDAKFYEISVDQPWTVKTTSEDIIYTSSSCETTYILEKTFRVQNTSRAPLNLVLKFQVDGKNVTLISKNLVLIPIPVQ